MSDKNDLQIIPGGVTAPKPQPLPSDGWMSRKLQIAAGVLSVATGIATYALVVELATFDQWASFMSIQIPSVLVPLFGAIGIDKFAEAKRATAQGR